MGIGKLESFLENHIEGFFNKKFSSDLEPVELSKALEKEIARQGKGKAQRMVPNQYVFFFGKRGLSAALRPADYRRALYGSRKTGYPAELHHAGQADGKLSG